MIFTQPDVEENGILPLVALLYLDRNTLLPWPAYLDPVNRCPSLRHLLAPVKSWWWLVIWLFFRIWKKNTVWDYATFDCFLFLYDLMYQNVHGYFSNSFFETAFSILFPRLKRKRNQFSHKDQKIIFVRNNMLISIGIVCVIHKFIVICY